MTSLTSAATLTLLLISAATADALGGSASTFAVLYPYSSSPAVCGIVADGQDKLITCHVSTTNSTFAIEPQTSYDYIAGGLGGFCAVRSGGYSLLCWNSSFIAKRIYYATSLSPLLTSLTFGDQQLCSVTNNRTAFCWRDGEISNSYKFNSISSGIGFSCGVLMNTKNSVVCWGTNKEKAEFIQSKFENESMKSIVAGGNLACGLNNTGNLICRGKNEINFPNNYPFGYVSLAVGENHACAIRSSNGTVICIGKEYSPDFLREISFEGLVSGLNFTCGLTTVNFSIICWGPGWGSRAEVPLPKILPGPCVQSNCSDCGIYPQSQFLCSGSGNICKQCNPQIISSPPNSSIPPSDSTPPSSPSRTLRKGLLAFAIVGSVGAFSGICTVIYCLWAGVCCGKKKVHNSVQPTMAKSNSNSRSPPSRSSTIRRQGSRLMRRQRSGTSAKHAEKAEEFSFSDLANATNNFSLENKIGAGSFGIVYKGKLWDHREVAIKRGETGSKTKKFQEKETAFDSELAFLSRLHHKHLVRLVGYCEDNEERLLVYEYMKNGALHDHLHDKNNIDKSSSVLNSWKMRIKIALDAAHGIKYLHNYAVPPIIHRDIKSSNILLDENWTARVSDFGLSLMEPESARELRPTRAVGTVGYIDPEYYSLNVLTGKSDVYGFGVVLLEILTGKRAVFKLSSDEGGLNEGPITLVEFAVPVICAGELGRVLDPRVGPPEMSESDAVELVGYTAVHCVNLEGKDRPNMTDIVANLERALALCNDNSHGSISSDGIAIVSE